MTALTFRQDKLTGRWIGYQPDGVRVGHVRASRKNDDRYAFEALLDSQHVSPDPVHGRRNHCGYADSVAGAMWMLVRGATDRHTRWAHLPEEY